MPIFLFLFTISITCLMYDIDILIKYEFGDIASKIAFTRLLLYADDTLFVMEKHKNGTENCRGHC